MNKTLVLKEICRAYLAEHDDYYDGLNKLVYDINNFLIAEKCASNNEIFTLNQILDDAVEILKEGLLINES